MKNSGACTYTIELVLMNRPDFKSYFYHISSCEITTKSISGWFSGLKCLNIPAITQSSLFPTYSN